MVLVVEDAEFLLDDQGDAGWMTRATRAQVQTSPVKP